ncbi:nucleotidyltransferase domain-containing protein [Agrococcus sp. ARC_14]|uniref:nucleotidyltransferase domain-containing protein n=1 Tax=Agrococcus sp. ARC_14 TaxID=2919927 RepID=UPI001F053A17|nr:nucleotidyltransferase domain-containing protein [Agrococcus sp. ARC_14]MCH1883333.1 nucleotidyltransferase domain-containing protein [Agrococcus sp. ARC_14]
MNLSEPLDGLTTAVGSAVLRVLARTDSGLSGRQVHALAGIGSTSSVHRALAGYVEVGLVSPEARPPAIIYRANREHVLWPVVELAIGARSRAFDSIRRFCEEDLPADLGLTVLVYGSVARRESTRESDLDLFVVYPDGMDEDARSELNYRIAQHVERITGNEAQVYSIERAELDQRIADHDPLVSNVLTDGMLVAGPALPRAARRAIA